MAEFRRAGDEQVNVFEIDGTYLFKHYFAPSAYGCLRPHYDHASYRFELPAASFDDVRRRLAGHGYALEPVAALSPYVVVVRQYTAHPDNIFKASVHQWSRDGYNLFLARRLRVAADPDAGPGGHLTTATP